MFKCGFSTSLTICVQINTNPMTFISVVYISFFGNFGFGSFGFNSYNDCTIRFYILFFLKNQVHIAHMSTK